MNPVRSTEVPQEAWNGNFLALSADTHATLMNLEVLDAAKGAHVIEQTSHAGERMFEMCHQQPSIQFPANVS